MSVAVVEEWETVNFGDIVNLKTGKLDSNYAEEGGKYPFFTCAPSPLRINDYAFDCEAILLAGNNANGIFHLNYYKGKFNAYQRTYVITVKDENKADLGYLYYHLHLSLKMLRHFSQGTSTKFLTMKILNNLDIVLPPIEEQREISKQLSDLDRKIRLSKQMNRKLESLGQAIFKRWFVDKEVDGEFTEGQLGDIMTLEYGKGLPKEKRESGNVPVYGSSGIYGYTEEFLIEGPGIIVGRAGCPGSVNISGKNFFPVDSTFYVNCEKEYFFYLYYMLKRLDLVRLNTGSAVPGLNRNNAYKVSIDYPDKETARKFNEICQHLFNKIWINQDQINNLEQIRDSLLPRLMSGKIRVPVEVN